MADLMVALQGFGQGVVDHKAHIGLVDAHAKGNGGSNDLHLVSCPVLLHPLPLIWGQASMVIPAEFIDFVRSCCTLRVEIVSWVA